MASQSQKLRPKMASQSQNLRPKTPFESQKLRPKTPSESQKLRSKTPFEPQKLRPTCKTPSESQKLRPVCGIFHGYTTRKVAQLVFMASGRYLWIYFSTFFQTLGDMMEELLVVMGIHIVLITDCDK